MLLASGLAGSMGSAGSHGKGGLRTEVLWAPPRLECWNVVNKDLLLSALIVESFSKVPRGQAPVCSLTVWGALEHSH